MTQTHPAPQAIPVGIDPYVLPSPVGVRVCVIGGTLEIAFNRIRSLESSGVLAIGCGDVTEVHELLVSEASELVVVDGAESPILLPRLVAACRQMTDAPLLAISAGGEMSEMSHCMEAGADDYCSANVSAAELLLRLRALLRRGMPRVEPRPPAVIRIGDLEIDMLSQTVKKGGRDIFLSPTEFRLLVTLAEHAGEIVPSRALIARVWGSEYAEETHYLRLYVRYLRQKIEDDPSKPQYIVNRWGAGYALTEPSRAA